MKKILTTLFTFSILTASAMALEPNKQAIEFYNQGIDFYQTGNIQKSIELFNSAISECPDFYEAYYNLAQIQYATNKLDDAIKTYEKIAELRPDDEENIYFLARSLYKRGYLARSLSYYQQLTPECVYFDDAKVEMDKLIKRQAELKQQELIKNGIVSDMQTPWVVNNVANDKQKEKTEPKPQEEKNIINIQSFEDEILSNKNLEVTSVKPIKIGVIDSVKSPAGVAIDSLGNTYIASFSDNAIYKIDVNSEKVTFASGEDIKGPIGLAVDKFDNLYIANYSLGNILKISQKGTKEIIATVKNPYFLTIKGDTLFVSEQVSNTVLKFKLY
ncbi:tetratricopeptide repeat protein [bacterium]|nr:tetratricopeptide repeat protein [bacterium]